MTQIYWIPGEWPGKLAILARPRGGDWLSSDIQEWRDLGLEVIVSLLTLSEADELGLGDEGSAIERLGMVFMSFPIPDRNVPESFNQVQSILAKLADDLGAGKRVGIHCRQGIGRSSMIAASLLSKTGLSPAAAFDRIEAARGCQVPDTLEQRQWVERLALWEKMRAA